MAQTSMEGLNRQYPRLIRFNARIAVETANVGKVYIIAREEERENVMELTFVKLILNNHPHVDSFWIDVRHEQWHIVGNYSCKIQLAYALMANI
jgi:hypothetical protein